MPAAHPEARPDFSPLLRERHAALAVSGGSDSVALMRLAQAWAAASHPELKLSVLTVDHGLREASALEARQVAAWAEAIGLSHHILSWEGPKPETGLQARARAARYGLLAGWCRAEGAGLLLTAHTLDDQAETVLMRLARTMSPNSLAGIPPFGAWQGLPVYRPFLGIRRQALRDQLESLGQGWVEDPSNADARFERVRVRQSLAVLGDGGVTPERLAELAAAGARTAALLERCAARWISLNLEESEEGVCHVPGEAFNSLPGALRQRILARIVGHYGGGRSVPEPDELRRLAAWAEGGPVRCTLAGALLGRRKDGFWVTREEGRISPEPLIIPEEGVGVWDRRYRIAAPPGTRVTAAGARASSASPEGAVPVFARRAAPWAEVPEGGPGPVSVTFLRLTAVEGAF